jgi:hypothetical protein
MRLDQIQKRTLITEGWNDSRLTLLETQHIIPFVDSIEKFIVEAKLTPDQISQLFTNVEQGATAAGGNRTLVGKGTDAAKFINTKMKELGQAVKKTGPVENADAKFAELKAKIGAKDSKVVSAIQGVSDWAKENPGKASIAVAVLTVAASMAAGPMAGAIAGFVTRASKDLLQGKDLSTAAGNAAKIGALGALAGGIADVFGDTAVDVKPAIDEVTPASVSTEISSDEVADAAKSSPEEISSAMPSLEDAKDAYAERISEVIGTGSINIPQEMMDKISDTIVVEGDYPNNYIMKLPEGSSMIRGEIFLTPDEAEAWDEFKQGKDLNQLLGKEGTEWIKQNVEGANEMISGREAADAAFDAELKAKYDAMSAEEQKSYDNEKSQQTIYTSGFDEYTPPGEPKYKESINFKNIQIETIIEWCDLTPAVMLTEGPMDAIKKGAAATAGAIKKGASAVGAKAAKVGKNMTTKVTADKLNKAWIKAGKPTDSDAIANILRQQGVSDQVLAPVYKQMGAKLPAAPKAVAPGAAPGQTAAPGAKPAASTTMDFKGIQQAVTKLSPQDAKALVTHIDSLGSKTATPNTAAKPAQATVAPTSKPAAQDATAAPTAPGQAPAAPNKNAAAGDTFEKAKGDIRKVQGGQKPMPPKTAATIASDLAKLAKGDKESGVAAAQKIMTFAKAGVDVSKQQQAWIGNAKAGERFLTQSVYFEITKMLKENNLSWSDLGMRVHLLEGTNKMFGISLI